MFNIKLLALLFYAACSSSCCSSLTVHETDATTTTTTATTASGTLATTTTGTTATATTTNFVPHRFSSHNNITILHEVHNSNINSKSDSFNHTRSNKDIIQLSEINTEAPLVLNTHEVLPTKQTTKKKSYLNSATLLFDKPPIPILTEYEQKIRPLQTATPKDYELHPVTFDFNLGDLEDLEHETFKKSELSPEEQFLLRNAKNEGFAYSAPGEEDDEETALGVAIDIGTPPPAPSPSPMPMPTPSTSSTSSTLSQTQNESDSRTSINNAPPLPTVETVSPHIFKITKNTKATKKGRELLKQDAALSKSSGGLRHNSINRYFGGEALNAEQLANGNSNTTGDSTDAQQQNVNIFQMLTNLFDHFYWQSSEIRTKVSTGCGLEMQAYLMALHGNYEWAQRAYDASGRYRGQLLFGNDKWLGAKTFCYELNRQLRPDERKHFEFEFYMATIALHLRLPQLMQPINLYLGECLPRSCTNEDVQSMLTLDPHAHMLNTVDYYVGNSNSNGNGNSNQTSATTSSTLMVEHVRRVPGHFSYWRELKFQLFASFMLSLLLIVIAATWYQAQLNHRELNLSLDIPAISAKLDASNGNGNGNAATMACLEQHAKGFELYQMRTLGNRNDNNNVVDIETDVNSNTNTNGNTNTKQQQQIQQQQQHDFLQSTNGNGNGNGNGNSNGFNEMQQQQHQQNISNNNNNNNTICTTTTKLNTLNVKTAESLRCTTPQHQLQQQQLHQQLHQQLNNEYELESNAGATITYEAKQQLGVPEKILLCFAFQTNASAILNIDEPNKTSQTTSCVHGLRVLSVLWTIMVHTYLQIFSIGENRFQRIIVERSIWYQIVGNATFSVDTFFFISGFLVTLLFLKHEKKYPEATAQFVRRSSLETLWLVIYRYIRLTPAYFFVILFTDFSLRQTYDASVFPSRVALNTCGEYWWRNILYINNFYPLQEICMIWSWYMANDMQFYIMASILLVLSTRYFKAAVLIVLSFLLSSWGVSGVISLHYHYTHKVSNPFESFDFLYDKPWQRVGTYIMGMLAGYILHKVKTAPKSITQRTNRLLWLGSLMLLALIIFGVWNGELSILNTAFYVGIGHTAFGLSLIWIVLSCCWGLSPTVNRILSYRGLWPLSRLTYCTYLIHPVIMLIISFRMGGTVHLSNLFVLIIFLGNAVVSFGFAFIISVLLEAPVIRLLKIGFKK